MADGTISFPMFGDFAINPASSFKVGPLTVHWYGVIIAVGFFLAVLYCAKRSKEFGLKEDNIYDAVIIGLPVSLIFARLYYIIFYPELFKDASFIDYIAIWNGGIAIYGGVIGAFLTVIVYSKIKKFTPLALLDLVCIGFLIGQFIGRWGNFMNREAYGYETDLPWRMGLTYGGVTTYVHPTFLYESLWNFAGFILLHFLSKKRKYDGEVLLMYLAWYGLGRAVIEGLRTDSLYIPGTGIRVSQLLAAVTCLVAVVLLVINRTVRKHDPKDMLCNKAPEESGKEQKPEEPGDAE
ncbi:MAG: prolipoprotein diacylglyceryl transferase [Oscillospiraceae bacterium]|nr:prolipoprotein diacylglyceryl transferase [Oscillospiraceae bacterium]